MRQDTGDPCQSILLQKSQTIQFRRESSTVGTNYRFRSKINYIEVDVYYAEFIVPLIYSLRDRVAHRRLASTRRNVIEQSFSFNAGEQISRESNFVGTWMWKNKRGKESLPLGAANHLPANKFKETLIPTFSIRSCDNFLPWNVYWIFQILCLDEILSKIGRSYWIRSSFFSFFLFFLLLRSTFHINVNWSTPLINFFISLRKYTINIFKNNMIYLRNSRWRK